jgi:hypothetical protein
MKSARERSLDFWMISLSLEAERERERERERENVGIGNPRHSLSSRNWEKKAKKKIERKTLNIRKTIRILQKIKYFRQHKSSFTACPLFVTTKPNTTITITTLEKEKEREREREERERVENSSTLVVVVKVFSSLDLRVIFYARGNCEFFTPPFSGENITPTWNFIHLL